MTISASIQAPKKYIVMAACSLCGRDVRADRGVTPLVQPVLLLGVGVALARRCRQIPMATVFAVGQTSAMGTTAQRRTTGFPDGLESTCDSLPGRRGASRGARFKPSTAARQD